MMNKGRRAGRGSGWGKGCRIGQAGRRGVRRPRYGRRSGLSSPPDGFTVSTIGESGAEIQALRDKVRGIVNELRSIRARIPRTEGTGTESSVPGDMNPAKSSIAVRRIPSLTATVNKERCVNCGICAAVCPEHAISIDDELMIDSDRCNGCGSCINACPNEAISLSGLRKAAAL
jgi:ferredoxin